MNTCIFVSIFLVCLATTAHASFNCVTYSSLETKAKCGKAGYLMGYGYKYCKRFESNLKKFNAKGQSWAKCTAACLQKRAKSIVNANVGKSNRCANIKTQAFNSHVNCYTSCGFCGVYGANLGALMATFQFSDLFSTESVKQIVGVGAKCLG
uniref:WSC domain-containing protein n=1 Tax=Panagrellus redivivus TaxID=6233 RepID=A0A7E4ZVJ4_PANRE